MERAGATGGNRAAEKCVREGCKGKALAGTGLCRAHTPRRQSGKQVLYGQILTDAERALFEGAPEADIFGLDHEIRMAMVALAHLFQEGRFADAMAVATRKAKLLETRKHLLGQGQDKLARELAEVLAELEGEPIGFKLQGGDEEDGTDGSDD